MQDAPSTQASCPFCHQNIYIPAGDGLFVCRKCHIAFNDHYKELSYDDSYFLDEYQNQYGKTYLDDFTSIYNYSKTRLNRIIRYSQKKPYESRLLDIGAAMGFFLKCARDHGYVDIEGIEISSFASQFSAHKFGISIHNDSIVNWETTATYDVISAWYVIEHMADPDTIIKKLAELLNEGGILALAVPSIFGPSFRKKRPHWERHHPKDHRTDFSPSFFHTYLKQIGFKRVVTFPAGFHPERLVAPDSFVFRIFSPVYRLYTNIFTYSDTMEVYAIK